MTPPKLITKRYHWRTWKQQFKPKPCSIHCMIGNVDTRFRQWTFVPYFQTKETKGCKWGSYIGLFGRT